MNVTFNFAGSQDLVAQLQQGASADVLATADTATMDKVADLVGTPQVFAGNKLEIAVAPGNPQHITGLADLGRTPTSRSCSRRPRCRRASTHEQILDAAGVDVKPVSLEESVKGVVTKVALGEADAGIVYVTDVTAAKGKVDGVVIPDEPERRRHAIPIAVVKASEQPARRAVVRRHGPLISGPRDAAELRLPAAAPVRGTQASHASVGDGRPTR